MDAVAPTQHPQLRTWRARIFAATWLSYACYYFARKPFFVAKGKLAEEFSIEPSVLGQVGSAYLIAYAVGQFIAGWAGDRWGPRVLLLTGMGTCVVAVVLGGLANSVGMLAALMAVVGLTQASGWSGNVGAMAPWFHREERGTVMGFWATNYQVGGVAATAFAAFILGAWGWRLSFFAGAAVLLAAWFVVLFNQRDRPEDVGLPPVTGPTGHEDDFERQITEEADAESPTWTTDTKINVAIVGIFYFFVKFVRYAIWSWVPLMLYANYGLAEDDAGYLSTVFDGAGVLGVIALGLLSDRLFHGRRAGLSFGFIIGMVAGCAALYLVGQDDLVLFTLCIGVIGFCLYGPDAIMTSAGAIDVGSRDKATLAAGIINGMGSIGAVAQELVVGRMLDEGDVGPVFALLLISSVLAAVCLGALLVRNRMGKADM